jgi:hypothetical protein
MENVEDKDDAKVMKNARVEEKQLIHGTKEEI